MLGFHHHNSTSVDPLLIFMLAMEKAFNSLEIVTAPFEEVGSASSSNLP